ncbi:unnamed protein product [Pleuronectes platessa]|uniref:Uncharacterized protein n=1 Tax=Pleuronectes platessa TaxID=8262 RepID=A0A9N7YIE7_PLEPL|nr:unnamed protein product [Pleuronectes platessa]
MAACGLTASWPACVQDTAAVTGATGHRAAPPLAPLSVEVRINPRPAQRSDGVSSAEVKEIVLRDLISFQQQWGALLRGCEEVRDLRSLFNKRRVTRTRRRRGRDTPAQDLQTLVSAAERMGGDAEIKRRIDKRQYAHQDGVNAKVVSVGFDPPSSPRSLTGYYWGDHSPSQSHSSLPVSAGLDGLPRYRKWSQEHGEVKQTKLERKPQEENGGFSLMEEEDPVARQESEEDTVPPRTPLGVTDPLLKTSALEK